MVSPEVKTMMEMVKELRGIRIELGEIRKLMAKRNSKFEAVKRYRSLDALFQEMDEDDEADMKD